MSPCGRGVGLTEAVEDVRKKLRRDPLARVRYADNQVGLVALDPNVDPPIFGREFDGIGNDIADDLLQTPGIGANGLRLRRPSKTKFNALAWQGRRDLTALPTISRDQICRSSRSFQTSHSSSNSGMTAGPWRFFR
jgi:hypothetical protein